MSSPVKVFISYANRPNSQENKDVLSLASRLRGDGIDCELDQYVNGTPAHGWIHWMEQHLTNADFILVVWSKDYLARYNFESEPSEGLGVKWESQTIRGVVYHADHDSKLIPVLFNKTDKAFIPPRYVGSAHYDVSATDGYERLYRHLTNQPQVKKPPIGELRILPSETIDVELAVKKEAARREILTFAFNCEKRIQTILAIANPSFYLAIGRTYNDEEEILYYIETLKELIREGVFEQPFVRAMRTYNLTHPGLELAKRYVEKSEPQADLALRLQKIEQSRLNRSQTVQAKDGYTEWLNFKNLLTEMVKELNLKKEGERFKIGSATHSSAGEIDYADAIFCHFYEDNQLELHFGKVGTSVGNKSAESIFIPHYLDSGKIAWINKKNEEEPLESRKLAESCLERLVGIV